MFNNNGIQEGSKPASTTSSIPSLDELPEQLPTIVREDCVIHPKGQTSRWGARDQEKWVYVKELGRGGFGVVQLERETKTNAFRAVKKISTNTVSKVDYKRELSILIALKDRTDLFVQFLGWYQEKGCISLAMEYVEHGDLRGYLKEFGQQSEGSAKEIGMQVLEGLVILHGRSICYRDLKPENILLSSLSPINIKLADFGISKTTVDTRLITRIGTDNYLAPELRGIYPKFLEADGEYKNSVDLWSLGCLLHEVMTLKLPFMVDSSWSFDSTITGVAAISSAPKVEFDYKAFYRFCDGEADLPTGTLQTLNISERGIEFIKSLLVPEPRFRPSAANAMKSEWLLELPQLSNVIISGQQRSTSDILRTQMLHLGIGVSYRTANILLNDWGGSNSETLLNELFPLLKTGTNYVLQGALKEVLKEALKSLIDSNSKDVLYAIVKDGHIGMVKLLLEKGVGVNARGPDDRTALHAAAEGGHADMAKLLLEKGADVNAKDFHGQTALHAAAGGGHVDRAKLLLEKGADIDAGGALRAAARGGHVDMAKLFLEKGADIDAGGALHAAAEGGHVDMAKLLLEKGADIDAGGALRAAARGGHVDMAKLLLEKGAEIDAGGTLHAAAEGGHVDMAKLLLEKGADIDAGGALRAAARGGHVDMAKLLLEKGADIDAGGALHAAARGGHVDMAKLLLEEGADIDAGGALHAAARGGHVDMAKLLLEEGADIDARDPYGETALHAAAWDGRVDMAKLLLEKGADVDAGGALCAAAQGGHVDMAKLLLEKGADVNAKDFHGQTALHAAAQGGHVDMAKLLLEKGADIDAGGALRAAARGGHVDMAKLLLEKGADVNAVGFRGQTALHAAAQGGHVDMAKLLLEKGADVNAVGFRGQTALHAAAQGGHTKIIALLHNK